MTSQGTLLCVDDDPGCLKVRQMLLESCGYKVCSITNGRDALDLFKKKEFDVVLVDYHMPGMNGAQVASEMRRIKPDVPIMMLSACTSLPESVTRMVNAFVAKTEPTSFIVSQIEKLAALRSSTPDSVWMLGAALATTALLGLAVQKTFRWTQSLRNSGSGLAGA